MKSTATKAAFIELRAEGLSYDKITGQLHISKATCSKWQAELCSEISEREQAHLQELYELYGMGRAARIERLGKTLQQIDEALDRWGGCMDLTPEQLINLKLKYEQALKAEYIEPAAISIKSEQDILSLKADTYKRLKAGAISNSQAITEINILNEIQQPLLAIAESAATEI